MTPETCRECPHVFTADEPRQFFPRSGPSVGAYGPFCVACAQRIAGASFGSVGQPMSEGD